MVWQNCAGTDTEWRQSMKPVVLIHSCFVDTSRFDTNWSSETAQQFRSHHFFLSSIVCACILLHEKFLQFDRLRAVVFQLNLKYPHVKYSPHEKYSPQMFFLCVWVVAWFVCNIWHKYHSWYFKIVSNFTRLTAREITYNHFEISLVVFMPNITTNNAITYTYKKNIWGEYILVI